MQQLYYVSRYRLKHCHEYYTKNKARGNKAKMANILALRLSAECFIFCITQSKAMHIL